MKAWRLLQDGGSCGCTGAQETLGVYLDPRGAQIDMEWVLANNRHVRPYELEIEEIEIGVLL